MSTPMPRLREKNACPNARIITEGVIAEKSGFRKNSRPSVALGRLTDTMQKPSSIMNNRGIIMLDKRSIPFCTPKSKITILMMIIINVWIRGLKSLEMYCSILAENKASWSLAELMPEYRFPVIDSHIYSKVHPATTM